MTEQTLLYHYNKQADIHEFKPLVSSRQVIQPYMDTLDHIMPEAIEQKKPCVLILWDLTEAEIYPLRLQLVYFKRMVEKYSDIPIVYSAYLTDRSSDITLINAHFTIHKDQRKIFSAQYYQNAVNWLVACRAKMSSANAQF